MESPKPKFKTNPRRLLWWISGVDADLLENHPSDWSRFSMIGFSSLLSALTGAIAFVQAMSNILFLPYAIVLGLIWGAIIVTMNRVISISESSRNGNQKALKIGIRAILALTIATIISIPFQLFLFQQQIGDSGSLFDKLVLLEKLKGEHFIIAVTSYLITFLFFTIELLPLIVNILTPKSLYQLTMETEREINYLQNQAKISRYISVSEELSSGKKKKEEIPLEGFEFYIDYKSLTLSDLNQLFSTINDLYASVFAIENFSEMYEIVPFSEMYRFEEYLRSHPEDTLLIHSIETGNSITFKLTTGWKPKVDLIDGDFVISLPKGSIALLITGFIITKVFDYGISSYKGILEIEKLQKEIKVMDNKALEEEMEAFNKKVENAPRDMQESFNRDLMRFYGMTLGNSNFAKTAITPDSTILQKLESGKYVLGGTRN